MPPRLGHKKTRFGCKRCKARRVKCDETHPQCGACIRHNVPCEYSKLIRSPNENAILAQATIEPPQASGTSVISTPDPEFVADDVLPEFEESPERRKIEICLFHRYMQIAPDLPSSHDPDLRAINLNHVPQVALQHDYLMNTILSLAALNFLCQSPPWVSPVQPEPDWATIHQRYLNLAIRQQRAAVTELSSHNAEAICFTAILLMHQSFKLLPQTRTSAKINRAIDYDPPIEWLSLSKSIRKIIQITTPLLSPDAGLLSFLNSKDPDLSDIRSMLGPEQRDIPELQVIINWATHPEVDADLQPLPLNRELMDTYSDVLSYCGSVYKALFERHEPPLKIARRLFAFGAVCPPQLGFLIEELRPRALVLLALFSSMMAYVDDMWWFKGKAESEVNGISQIVGPQWSDTMRWIQLVKNHAAAASISRVKEDTK